MLRASSIDRPHRRGPRAPVRSAPLLGLLLIACGAADDPAAGDAASSWPYGVSTSESRGREVFLAQGCDVCHDGRADAPADAFDLRTTGAPRSAGWHALHLFKPSLARAFSTMPAARELFEPTDWIPDDGLDAPAPQLTDDGAALVDYLFLLQRLPARATLTSSGLAAWDDMDGGPDDMYRAWCAACHGSEGRGDGAGAAFLADESAPRAFRPALYRVRSRPGLPTDDDLFTTLTDGLPGTAMPDFSHLSEADRWALVRFVQGYARHVEDGVEVDPFAAPREPLPVGDPPRFTPEGLARGAELIGALQCASCHPELGADAPTVPEGPPPGLALDPPPGLALGWVDEVGRPLPRAPNLVRGRLKGGASARSLYLRVMCGAGGAPMPSFADALPDEGDRWALVSALWMRRANARDDAGRPHAASDR